jgi:hypothetical protein
METYQQEEIAQILIEQYQTPEERERLFSLAFEVKCNSPEYTRLECLETASLNISNNDLIDGQDPEYTRFYAIECDHGYFRFFVLLNDEGKIWPGTQVLEWYPRGGMDPAGREIWDNQRFILDCLAAPTQDIDPERRRQVEYTRLELGENWPRLVKILLAARAEGWLIQESRDPETT